LQWYHDKSSGSLPQGWVISLPMMVYRIVMLLWSLWLAFSLMSWIRWAWLQLGVQGHWYTPASVPATSEKSAPETVAQNLQTNDEVKPAD
jgi:hypothetical protein